jgi:ERCC4-type nuclease
MKLYIDNREPKSIIDYILRLNESNGNKFSIIIKNLELGDYIITRETEKVEETILIIERKSLPDLESSIKDGRYSEQSIRLSEQIINNHNIYYLIEGSIVNYKNKNFKNTLYSTMLSVSYFKGFSVINSLNSAESAELIYNFLNKLNKETNKTGFHVVTKPNMTPIINNESEKEKEKDKEKEKEKEYLSCIKTIKKDNITPENIHIIMLMQIPGISVHSASSIMADYKTIKNLVENLEQKPDCLENIKLENTKRNLNKNIILNIKKFLL